MALGSCRECGKQVSDQAEVCPNCGIKQPVLASGPAYHAAQSSADEPILSLNGVIVTKTLAKFPSQTFPINGIGSVRQDVTPPSRKGWVITGIVFGVMGVGGLSNTSADGGGVGVGLFFFVIAAVALLIGFSQKEKHVLFLRTASGDTKAMEGDAKTLGAIKDAIEKAATMRG